MPPKQKGPKQLGDVNEYGDGWRVVAKIDGTNCQGPKRKVKGQAQKDLSRAQRCETRHEMRLFLQALHGLPHPLAGAQAATHELSQGLPQVHHVDATSGITQGPGSASSLADASRATKARSGGRSAAQKILDRLEHQRVRQRSEGYRANRRTRETTEKFRFARSAYEKQWKCRAKKKAYQSRPETKISRSQRRWAEYWSPCFYNWTAVRREGHGIDQQMRLANNAAVYAPRFHADGRISILQGGEQKFLPCPQEPPQNAKQEHIDEFRLALALRCRIGAINCRRAGDSGGCSSRLSRKAIAEAKALRRSLRDCGGSAPPASGSASGPRGEAPVLEFGGCVHTSRRYRFPFHCEAKSCSDSDLEDMAVLCFQEWLSMVPASEDAGAEERSFSAFPEGPANVCVASIDPGDSSQCKAMPKPSSRARQFLCSDDCPRQCSTLHCPWNSLRNHESTGPEEIITIFGDPCTCQLSSCLRCIQERSLQKFKDCLSGVAGLRGVSLQDPPPIGYEVYGGIGEPVSDSPSVKRQSKLYRLECVPWSLEQRVVRRPPRTERAAFQDLSLMELLHFNGYNEPEMYRRPVRSYAGTMQPLLDNYVVDHRFSFKLYGEPRKVWTPPQAKSWNAQASRLQGPQAYFAEPLPSFGGIDSAESGWEWRWQEDVEASAKDTFKVGGAWKVGSEAFSAQSHLVEEWVRLSDGTVVSTRCSACTLAHGPPKLPQGFLFNSSAGKQGLPEDIAIAFAKCVVRLRATLNGQVAVLRPSDVVAVERRVAVIASAVEGFPKAAITVDVLRAVGGCGPTGELDGAASCAVADFVRQASELVKTMKQRASEVREACCVCGWCPATNSSIRSALPSNSQPRAHCMSIDRVRYECHLDNNFTQEALNHRAFESPVFALVDDICGMPRQTRGATTYCVCNMPWNKRPTWERLPWTVYELPPVHEEWEAVSLQADRCTAWLYRGEDLVEQPLAFIEDLRTIRAVPCSSTHRMEVAPTAIQLSLRPAPGARSCLRPPSTSCGDLAAWASDDEAEGADSDSQSERGGVEGGGEEESQEAAEGSEDESVEGSLIGDSTSQEAVDLVDVEDPEGYFDCPQTPPRKTSFQERVVWNHSAQKEDRPTRATANDDHTVGPVSDSPGQKRLQEVALQCSDTAARERASGSVVPASPNTARQETMPSWMLRTLLKVNAASQREQLSKHPQLRQYAWSSGQCTICEEWHYKSQKSFVIRHCCGVVHCGGCYEEHQGKCPDPRIRQEIQASREALFEKYPELRSHVPISGTCAACADEMGACHQFLFTHCCGLAICGDCYLDHLPYCTGGGVLNDDFVIGDDESSDDHGIAYAPDAREERW